MYGVIYSLLILFNNLAFTSLINSLVGLSLNSNLANIWDWFTLMAVSLGIKRPVICLAISIFWAADTRPDLSFKACFNTFKGCGITDCKYYDLCQCE